MSIFKKLKNKVKTLQKTTAPKPTMWSVISSFEASRPSIFNQERSMYKRGGYMGGGTMVDKMQSDMKKKMEKPRGGYAHGGKPKSGKADIAAMEKACSAKVGKNKSVSY